MRAVSCSAAAKVVALLALSFVSISFLLAAARADDCAPGIIETVAGIGDPPDPPDDGGPATEAILNEPMSVAAGADGSLYVAEWRTSRVRKVDPNGIITTIAGDSWKDEEGRGRYAGDGGPGRQASLSWPHGVAVGADDSVYIADTWSHRIRKIDRDGIITTVAGGGEPGDGIGDGGPATEARLGAPHGVVLGADGSVYVADTANHRVRKIDPGGIITTVAGSDLRGHGGDGGPATEALLHEPEGVAVAGDGTIYIADTWNHRIRKVDTTGVITTVAGDGWKDKRGNGRYAGDGGAATAASLNMPTGLALGAEGSLYIADCVNWRIRKVDPAGIITTVAGNGDYGYSGDGVAATAASLWAPNAVALGRDGSLYVADMANLRIRKVDPTGVITTVAGRDRDYGDGGPAVRARLDNPSDVAVGTDGSLYIADTGHSRVRKIDPAGVITTVAGNGDPGYSGDGGPATEARLRYPLGVALEPDGTLYIADSGNGRVRKVDPAGMITTVAGDGWRDDNGSGRFAGDGGTATEASLWGPCAVAVAPDGSVYIADTLNGRVRKVDRRGVITTVVALTPPHGIALDAEGNLYVGEAYRVCKIGLVGGVTTVAGGGRDYCRDGEPAKEGHIHGADGLAAAPDGTLYIAERFNHRILKVSADGIVTIVAGSGPLGQNKGDYAGDGGPATKASLNAPMGVALAPDGSLYVADSQNHRIRKVCGGQPEQP